ncbi:hypothetical protein OXX69_008406 [Metschnikowia pulcherrima]
MTPSSRTESQLSQQSQIAWLICTSSSRSVLEKYSHSSQAYQNALQRYDLWEAKSGTNDYALLQRVWPNLSECDFAVVDPSGTHWLANTPNAMNLLGFLTDPHAHGVHDPCLDLYHHFKEQISCASGAAPSVPCADTAMSYAEAVGSDKDSRDKCMLSIRLMEGGHAKAQFNSSDCLMDVKRWLQQEHKIPLVPEDDESTSRYTKIGHFEPSRYAFFYPATRKTFSEAQEFLRLADLGLCPRSALILRPDYDENAMKAAREAESSRFRNLCSHATHILQALYSFFDYGVDDASQDIQDSAVSSETGKLHPPHFLGSSGPVPPSASIIDVRQGDASDPTRLDGYMNHDTCSQANNENVVNVVREEF